MCERARGDEVKQLRDEPEKSTKGCLDWENQAQVSKVRRWFTSLSAIFGEGYGRK